MSEELNMTPKQTLAFFASVIKSGEPWTGTCQKAYDEAMAALSSPRVEDVRREALEEAAAVADEYARLPPLFNHGTQPSRAEKAVMEAAAIIAQDIRALSPPVG